MGIVTGSAGASSPTVDDADKGSSHFVLTVSSGSRGQRLDQFLVARLENHSRASLSRLIREGHVLVDNRKVKPGLRLTPGQAVSVYLPPAPTSELQAQPISFDILFEDTHLLVLVKPPGLVVHPAAGHASGTLVNGLLHHCRNLPALEQGRPGIVHRLDKDTSGIMVVAKSEEALTRLADDFKQRRIAKHYHAILVRCPAEESGRLVAPIGRHPVHRKKMAIRPTRGRYAVTSWEVEEVLARGFCLVRLSIETGRTHQIRVHMASLGCPVAGDQIYGGRLTDKSLPAVERQLLHASEIRFNHPVTGRKMRFSIPLWPDMTQFMEQLGDGAH